MPDQSFPLGGGWIAFDAAPYFSGAARYEVICDPGLATLDGATGLLRVNTDTAVDATLTIRAINSAGRAEGSFAVSVYPVGVDYWKIEETFCVS